MEQLPTTAWMPPLKGGPSQRGLWVDKGTTPRMGEVDRVGNTRSRATHGAVAEQTANSQIMADCLSANPPFELKTWRVFDREGIVVNPILNRIEPSQSKFHVKTKNRPAGNGLVV
jgi:hypothetical protein